MRAYQSILYLFPSGHKDGANWSRMGIQLCMFPKAWQVEGARESLLIGSINGVPAKASAGVRFGHLQVDNPYPPKALNRLPPKLNANLTQARLDKLLARSGARKPVRKADLQRLSSKKLRSLLSLEAMQEIAHPRCLEYMCGADDANRNSARCLKRPACHARNDGAKQRRQAG